ncbi:MAG: T9SS type A sorting domain-containing protein, partial [Flavobacteriales bacterium]
HAQLVFIPDTDLRDWLNYNIPGIVDGAGYMDTAHPGIPSFTYGTLLLSSSIDDLSALQYLTGLTVFLIDFDPGSNPPSAMAFPPQVTRLTVRYFAGTTLPPLPAATANFTCMFSSTLTSLPTFPSTLDTLWLMQIPVPSIPSLPERMWGVDISTLTSLTDLTGILPDTLDSRLYISECPLLASLGQLPTHFGPDAEWGLALNGLTSLQSIPAFPPGVEELSLSDLPLIAQLPVLPDSLTSLYLSGLPLITCIPTLPTTMMDLSYWGDPGMCVPNINPGMTSTIPLCGFFNTFNCPYYQPSFAGTVYHDANGNSVRDTGEQGVANATVTVNPGGTLLGTDINGFYTLASDTGTHTLTATVNSPYVTSVSPTSRTVVLQTINDADSLNDFGAVLQPNIQDLSANLTAFTPARNGFVQHLQLTYTNAGTIPMDGDVEFSFDSDMVWSSSNPAPDAINGNVATWDFTNLVLNEQRSIQVFLITTGAVPIGTPVEHTVVAGPVATDQTQADNTSIWSDVVVGSFDPNDKTLVPDEMTTAEVAAGEHLTYTIRFQNTGTYQADRVIITDTLSSDLQWNSMQLLASSHTCTWLIHDGTLRFTFDPIALPDSTSDEPGSHGFVTFSMLPDAGLVSGAQIGNTANIFFDFNAPVITNEALFAVVDPMSVVDHTSAGFRIWPNPTSDVLNIECADTRTRHCSIIDVTGRPVMHLDLSAEQNRIDLIHLASGSYVLRVDDGTTWPIIKH